jgi:hypothetical protein
MRWCLGTSEGMRRGRKRNASEPRQTLVKISATFQLKLVLGGFAFLHSLAAF